MYLAISLLAILLSYYTAHAHTLPSLPNPTNPFPLTSPNPPPTYNSTTTPQPQQQQNTTTTPLSSNFLGIECYHLIPSTVTLLACQPLFAKLLSMGDAYEENYFRNGFQARINQNPCTLSLSSPDRKLEHNVRVAMADMVIYATEILEECTEIGTGGAYVFRGSWRVVVTRDPVDRVDLSEG